MKINFKFFKINFWILLILNILDVLTTTIGLKLGLYEQNKIAVLFFENNLYLYYYILKFFSVYFIVFIFISDFLLFCKSKHKKLKKIFLCIIFLLTISVNTIFLETVINNIYQIILILK